MTSTHPGDSIVISWAALVICCLGLLQCSFVEDFSGISDGEHKDAGTDSAIDQSSGKDADTTDTADTAPDCDQDSGSHQNVIAQVNAGAITVGGKPGEICNEAAWKSQEVTPVPFFFQQGTLNGECRLLWEQGPPSKAYGCCQFKDSDLVSISTGPETQLKVHLDDSIEFFIKGDSIRTLPGADKVLFNLLGSVVDVGFKPVEWDYSFDAKVDVAVDINGTLNDSIVDTGYTVEWSQELSFIVNENQSGLLGLRINDYDAGGKSGIWNAFKQNVNAPAEWGTLLFSCRRASP